jgi:Protein of unknown function (DUF1676)
MRNFKSAIFALAISLQLCMCDTNVTISGLNLIKNDKSDNVTEESVKQKPTLPLLSTGNELWDGLIKDCLKKPTFSCIQKNVYSFLDATLGLKDVNITNRVQLTQNNVDYKIPEQPNDEENEIFFEGRGKFQV